MSALWKEDKYTPPSSDVEPETPLPPSPPQSPERGPPRLTRNAAVLLRDIRYLKAGKPVSNFGSGRYRISEADFGIFEARLEEDEALGGWYHDKVHYDYDAAREEYVLRMPSAVHEAFARHVTAAILSAIGALATEREEADDEGTAKALRGIYDGGSTTLEMVTPKLDNSSQESAEGAKVHRSPDGSFWPAEVESQWPSLVVEVSYSQHCKDLPRLADSYLIDTQHGIRCVVGFDITYARKKDTRGRSKTATVSLWRPGTEKDGDGEDVGVCDCHVDGEAFRDEEGKPCDGELLLSLPDLLHPELVASLPSKSTDHHITISFADLHRFLAQAEALEAASRKTQARAAPTRFRKRKRTPPEELSDGREAKYSKQEEGALRKDQNLDGEWAGSKTAVATEPQLAVRRSKRNKSGRAVGDGS